MPNLSAGSQSGLAEAETNNASKNWTMQQLDMETFRRELANLIDVERQPESAVEHESVKQDAIRFCSILAHLFGESLDRTTLWVRIGSALCSALAKVSDDLDRFATLCLEHICADDGQVAACVPMLQLLQTWQTRTSAWRQALMHYMKTHRSALLVYARARWEQVKSGEVDL